MPKSQGIQQFQTVEKPVEISQSSILVQVITAPAFLIFLVSILVIVYLRKELKELLKEITQFIKNKANKVSLGGNRGLVVTSDDIPKEEKKIGEQAVPEPESKEKPKDVEEIKEPVTLEDWQKEMFFAFFDKDETKAKEALTKIKGLTESGTEYKKEEIKFFYLNHIFLGNSESISNIEKYIDDPEVKSFVYEKLGQCYDDSKDYTKALDFYKKALDCSSSNEEKVEIIIKLSKAYYKDFEKENAINIVRDNITNFIERDLAFDLYQQLAELYEEEKDFENRAYCLQKSLELRPNDAKLLFSIGYAYSQKKLDALSLLHYKLGRYIGKEDATLLNNMGVAYERLNLPINSIKLYKTAFEKGETLAGANLAYSYINAGFQDEAQKIIDEAKIKEDVHPNVGEALATLSKNTKEEEKKEEDILKLAERQKKFIIGFTDAYFPNSSMVISTQEKWQDENKLEYRVSISDNVISIFWEKDEEKFKINGPIENRASRIQFFKFKYDWRYTEKKFIAEDDGLLYFSTDCKKINIMVGGVLKNNEPAFYFLEPCII